MMVSVDPTAFPASSRSCVKDQSFPSRVILVAITALVGLALRLYHLNFQSVWYDEIFSLTVSHQPFKQMICYLVKDIVQPPLHYVLLHLWFDLVGFGPYQARFLSVIFGVLAILATYGLSDYLFGHRTAVIAAALISVSQLAVMYSQEARPYGQLLFLTPCCAYLFIVALRTGSKRTWWFFVFTALLLVYTHYYGFFVLAALLLFTIFRWRAYSIPVYRWMAGAAVGFAFYLPWLSSGVIAEWLHSSKGFSHTPSRPRLPWWSIFSAINTFNNGRPNGVLESSPWWTFVAGAFLFGLPVLLAVTALMKKSHESPSVQLEREHLVLLLLLWLIPFTAGLAIGFKSGAYNIRYITFAAVPYYILVARGISMLGRAALRTLLACACVLYSAHALRANYSVPYKEDYRGAYEHLAKTRQADDCYVVAPTYEERQAKWAWTIYHEYEPALHFTALGSITSGQDHCARAWLISILYRSTPPAVNESKEAREKLGQSHVRIEGQHYFWVDLDLYVPKKR
jgi:4-amino-4-deoxy-L-arabinose transferase-like glycosyltransferase